MVESAYVDRFLFRVDLGGSRADRLGRGQVQLDDVDCRLGIYNALQRIVHGSLETGFPRQNDSQNKRDGKSHRSVERPATQTVFA